MKFSINQAPPTQEEITDREHHLKRIVIWIKTVTLLATLFCLYMGNTKSTKEIQNAN